MYEISEQDSGFLGLDFKKTLYINMLLKHAYQQGYMDSMDECKSILNQK